MINFRDFDFSKPSTIAVSLRWLLGVIAVGFLTAWFTEIGWFAHPTQTVYAVLNTLKTFVTDPLFVAAAIFLAGLTLGVLIDPIRRRLVHDAQPETRLRLRLEPGTNGHYAQETKSNIAAWWKPPLKVGDPPTSGPLLMIFDVPSEYEDPVIESSGQGISHTAYRLGNRGAVIQFSSPIEAHSIEIWFPPKARDR